MKKKKRKDKKVTFTKKLISIIIGFGIFDLQLSYVLAFLGREQIAETLSITIVTELIASILSYCAKSFFETREEEKMKFERERYDMDILNEGDNENGNF